MADEYIDKINLDRLIEIQPEFVYLTIPTKYVCIYHRLLSYMSDFGKLIIDDCSYSCKGDGKQLMNCWNIFQSAIACFNLGKTEEGEFLINYVDKQISSIYKGSDKEVYCGEFEAKITPDGRLVAKVDCEEYSTFYVDAETGELYQHYFENKEDSRNYSLSDIDYSSDV